MIISRCCLVVCIAWAQLYAAQAPDNVPTVTSQALPEVTEWSNVQGVDTMGDVGRGNWFKKKGILQRARRLYQDMRPHVKQSVQLGQEMLKKYEPEIARISQQLASLGIKQEDIGSALTQLNESIEKFAVQGSQTDVDKKHIADLHEIRELLNEFVGDMTYVIDLHTGLQQALAILRMQTNQSQAYEKRAWQLYELIDAAFNDKIAEQLFEEMKAIAENVGSIETYITADLKNYFERSIPLLQDHAQKGLVNLKLLQDRGYFVQPAPQPQAEQKVEPAQAKPQPRAWWSYPLLPILWLWQYKLVLLIVLVALASIPMLYLVRWLLAKFKK